MFLKPQTDILIFKSANLFKNKKEMATPGISNNEQEGAINYQPDMQTS